MRSIEERSVLETQYEFEGQSRFYKGKVRDVYTINEELIMVATDRISAFDHILPRPIPCKGQVLNQIANHFLEATKDIAPNWRKANPDPNVTAGVACQPFPIEMVIRGYLTGHAWRTYKSGLRELCGVTLPEGMKEHDPFPTPIITPATKAEEGHDEDISKEDILAQGIVSAEDYAIMEKYTYQLFERGTEMAAEQGLILVDTKYEFGKSDNTIYVIDEIHTPDSSRYFYKDGYEERQAKGDKQKHLSKEFVREWLIEHGFQGLDGQLMPEMPDHFIESVTDRYVELFEQITGQTFVKENNSNVVDRIEKNILNYLKKS